MGVFDDLKEYIEKYFQIMTTKYKKSSKWKEYRLGRAITHCDICYDRNHKIYEARYNEPELPEHINCKCSLNWLRSLKAGEATDLGTNGADYYLKYFGCLPDYYITKQEAKSLGWKSNKGNLDKVAPGKMLGGNIFKNKLGLLPNKENRIWYECDIDYQGGYRNNTRLVYSNDGLIFKTDNHYTKFIAIE